MNRLMVVGSRGGEAPVGAGGGLAPPKSETGMKLNSQNSSSVQCEKRDEVMHDALSAYVHTILHYIRDQAISTYDRWAKQEADALKELRLSRSEDAQIERASLAHGGTGGKGGFQGGV